MTMLEKIPALSDGDLASLLANATRLSETGSKRQQDAANELIPALNDETEQRRAAKAAIAAARPKTRKKAAAVAPVVVANEADDEDDA